MQSSRVTAIAVFQFCNAAYQGPRSTGGEPSSVAPTVSGWVRPRVPRAGPARVAAGGEAAARRRPVHLQHASGAARCPPEMQKPHDGIAGLSVVTHRDACRPVSAGFRVGVSQASSIGLPSFLGHGSHPLERLELTPLPASRQVISSPGAHRRDWRLSPADSSPLGRPAVGRRETGLCRCPP
jgi:hypothetical protein